MWLAVDAFSYEVSERNIRKGQTGEMHRAGTTFATFFCCAVGSNGSTLYGMFLL